MTRILIVGSCILFVIVTLAEAHNKYSKEANQDGNTIQRPFRMQKLNLLWEKASKKFDSKTLKRLYEDFKHQDKDEIALKRIKSEGQDKDGMQAAQVRKQFNLILRKYDLNWEDSNQVIPSDHSPHTMTHEKPLFKDKKLDKLWKKAHKADLTEPQLKILKEELRHYEEKMNQYHELISELSNKQMKEHSRLENMENHIDAFLESEEALKDRVSEELNNKLKEKHVELKEEYQRLSDAIFNASVGAGGDLRGEFEEERASKLWNLALKSDFNDKELESLRDELLHFQTRIKKLKFFQAQMESDKLAGKNAYNEVIDDEGKNHHKHIAHKVKDLNYKVDKLHGQIEDRILRRHTEL